MSDQAVIRELTDIQGIQLYPSLYIGPTEYCTHLVNELIVNCRDEIIAGHCDRMDIFTYTDNSGQWFVARDYGGKGIPTTSPEIEGDALVKICSKLHSGGKFRDDKHNGYYKDGSGGMYGIGLTAVNALSKYLIITTRANDENDNHWQYFFEDGQYKNRQLVKLKQDGFNPIYATEVRFIPSSKYFQNLTWDESLIKELLSVTRYGLPDNIQINFQGQPVPNTYLNDYFGQYNEIIEGYYIDKTTGENCNIHIALYDDFDSGKEFKGMVNLLIANNGTHQNLCFNLLKNNLFAIAEKKKKHVQINDLLVPIKILCSLKIKKPQFDGQVKDKLDVRQDDIKYIIEPVINLLLKNNSLFFQKVIDKAEEYRINLESSKASKKSKLGKTIQVRGLRDCSSKNRNERSLYLVEGNSAAGSAIKARDARIHGILPLRGKLLNVIQATKSKILNNDVINSIANTLGYKLYGEVNPEKCRYSSIFITTDADNDGFHIACLLTFVFYTLFPELIKAGMLYVILCPLYGVTVNKQFIPIFDDITRQQYNNQGIVTRRFKGLGEMCANELKVSMFDINYRRCLQLKYSDFDLIKLWNEQMGKLTYEEN